MHVVKLLPSSVRGCSHKPYTKKGTKSKPWGRTRTSRPPKGLLDKATQVIPGYATNYTSLDFLLYLEYVFISYKVFSLRFVTRKSTLQIGKTWWVS